MAFKFRSRKAISLPQKKHGMEMRPFIPNGRMKREKEEAIHVQAASRALHKRAGML